MSVPLLLMVFCLYFIGAISSDICNTMLSRISTVDPEFTWRPILGQRTWCPSSSSRDAAHIDTMTWSCEFNNLGATDHSKYSWEDTRVLPERNDKAPTPSFLPLALKLEKADLPEPRRLLLQEKAPGLHLVNIVPGGELSLYPSFKLPTPFPLPPQLVLLAWALGTKTFEQIHRNMLIDRQAGFLLPWGGHRLVEHCQGKRRNEQLSNSTRSCILMYSNMSPQGVCRPSGVQGVWAETISLNCWSRHPNRILDLRLPYGDWLTLVTGLTKTPS